VNDNLLTQEDFNLFTTGTRFVVGSVLWKSGMRDDVATFDLYVRELPPNRNYLIFAGLPSVINFLKNLRFTPKQIAWLHKSYNFEPDFLKYLRKFRFTGDIFAMKEGTIFFPNEPIIRVKANIIEATIIEMFLINSIYFPTIFASKLSRFLTAAGSKRGAVAYNRSYGPETALQSERVKEMLGTMGGLALYSYRSGVPTFSTGTYHYLFTSFDSEIEAMRAYLLHTKGKGYVLIDTYESIRGIKNFIKVAKELEKINIKSTGIQIDSGDLYGLSVKARKMLDAAGLSYVKIFVMGNLDEWRVSDLEKNNPPIDVYSAGTELLTPTDAPTLELVYKLSEIERKGKIYPKMKLSSEKKSFPGRKQVYRIKKNGLYVKDIIGLEGEKLGGEKLLIPMIKNGKSVYKLPALKEIGDFYKKEKQKFDKKLFAVDKKVDYKIEISKKLSGLAEKTKKEIEKIHHSND